MYLAGCIAAWDMALCADQVLPPFQFQLHTFERHQGQWAHSHDPIDEVQGNTLV